MKGDPVGVVALRDGLMTALTIYLREADLGAAVGESGRIYANLEVHLEKGRPDWTKGAVYFERRIDFRRTT